MAGPERESAYPMRHNLNLTPERGPNVWNRTRTPTDGGRQTGSALGGAVMLAAGATAAFLGGRMLYRAIRDGWEEAGTMPRLLPPRGRTDLVSEESADSFPASDAPSWTSTGATLELRAETT